MNNSDSFTGRSSSRIENYIYVLFLSSFFFPSSSFTYIFSVFFLGLPISTIIKVRMLRTFISLSIFQSLLNYSMSFSYKYLYEAHAKSTLWNCCEHGMSSSRCLIYMWEHDEMHFFLTNSKYGSEVFTGTLWWLSDSLEVMIQEQFRIILRDFEEHEVSIDSFITEYLQPIAHRYSVKWIPTVRRARRYLAGTFGYGQWSKAMPRSFEALLDSAWWDASC